MWIIRRIRVRCLYTDGSEVVSTRSYLQEKNFVRKKAIFRKILKFLWYIFERIFDSSWYVVWKVT